MEQLTPDAIGRARWQSFDEAAQAYDFQLLEERIRAFVARLDAYRAAVHPAAR